MLSGALAGLLGAWAMSIFAGEWERRVQKRPCREQLFCGSPQEREATENIASRFGARFMRGALSRREQEIGAAVVHYATGAALGAAYALGAELAPAVTAGSGVAYGAAFWAFGDELLLPAAGLLRRPAAYAAAAHLAALGEHVVYGIVTDRSHKFLRTIL